MKDAKTTIMHAVNLVVGVLTYVFLSQPYMAAKVAGYPVSSGYDLIDGLFNSTGGTAASTMMALSTFFVSIIAGLLIISSIYGLLVSFDVVKNDKHTKIFKIVDLVLTSLLVVFGMIALICTGAYISETVGFSTLFAIGWAVIVNFVIAILALAASVFNFIVAKKNA